MIVNNSMFIVSRCNANKCGQKNNSDTSFGSYELPEGVLKKFLDFAGNSDIHFRLERAKETLASIAKSGDSFTPNAKSLENFTDDSGVNAAFTECLTTSGEPQIQLAIKCLGEEDESAFKFPLGLEDLYSFERLKGRISGIIFNYNDRYVPEALQKKGCRNAIDAVLERTLEKSGLSNSTPMTSLDKTVESILSESNMGEFKLEA